MKRHAPAVARNRLPIAEVLERALPSAGEVLEIASGSGEHIVYFAERFPHLGWIPSDVDEDALASARAHLRDAALSNVREPIALDAAAEQWPVQQVDAIVCINMIHIAPMSACLGLFAGARRALPPGGLLYAYGPYRISDRPTAPSNEAFDASLRARNPAWGLRELDDVERAAQREGLVLEEVVDMPANNISALFRRRA